MKYIGYTTALIMILSLGSIQAQKVNWMSIQEAEEASKEEPRKVIIDVYTDWCGWCKRMDQTTFSNPVIAEYINDNYYAVKLDAEQKDSIYFKDHTFKYVAQGRRGYHELAAALLNGKMSYPNIVYMNEQMQVIQAVPGYQDAKSFEKTIKFFGDDHFLETSWEDFQKSFVSEL
jgi:thioredoxin-related protein